MEDQEMPALTEELSEPQKAPVKAPEITAQMQVDAAAGVDAAFAVLHKQPKERIRVHKDLPPQVVIINGARFNIPTGVAVDVPQQVAEVLRESGRI